MNLYIKQCVSQIVHRFVYKSMNLCINEWFYRAVCMLSSQIHKACGYIRRCWVRHSLLKLFKIYESIHKTIFFIFCSQICIEFYELIHECLFFVQRIVCYLHRSIKCVVILEGAGSVKVFLNFHKIYESIYKTMCFIDFLQIRIRIYESIHY